MKSATEALRAGADALARLQEDGHWEGEMRWCPMLTAQYVLFHHALELEIPAARKKLILRHLETNRIADGTYGLHDHAAPSLYVSTLAYVAARLSGAPADEEWLMPTRALLARERVSRIATWGRAWLAIVGLYEWDGMNPMPPELWAAPRDLPIHPSKFYCHTRLIYLGLSLLRTEAKPARWSPIIDEIRAELYPFEPYEAVDFRAERGRLCPLDVAAPVHPAVRAGFVVADLYEKVHARGLRARIIAELRERIRWELETTDHLGVSPVSGMLGMLALDDRESSVVKAGIASLETWAFEDEEGGFRITGARSQTWDTAFAIQALVAASPAASHTATVSRATEYLAGQQIREAFPGFEKAYRIDPTGGFCFAHREHGWPVSDCTAEALIALLEVGHPDIDDASLHDAVRFILRCQNADGGFGSYEPQRGSSTLDWMNPAEMFLDCVTERSYVECTASAVMALAAWRTRFPDHPLAMTVIEAIHRGAIALRRAQLPDGSWDGVWGVGRIYGTMFGVRGLRAAGIDPTSPSIENAVRFLEKIQHADGSFGEHERGGVVGKFIDLGRGHVVQTSWALIALVESGVASAIGSIDRATAYLVASQRADGTYARDRMVGVFFRTALVDYDLYRAYFPVWALGLVEETRRARSHQTRRGPDAPTHQTRSQA